MQMERVCNDELCGGWHFVQPQITSVVDIITLRRLPRCVYTSLLSLLARPPISDSKNMNSKQICVFVLHVRFDIMSEVGGKWFRALRRPCFGRKMLYAFKQLMKNERDLSVINMRILTLTPDGTNGGSEFFTEEGGTPWGIEGKQQSRGNRWKNGVINLELGGLRRSPHRRWETRTATLMFSSFFLLPRLSFMLLLFVLWNC